MPNIDLTISSEALKSPYYTTTTTGTAAIDCSGYAAAVRDSMIKNIIRGNRWNPLDLEPKVVVEKRKKLPIPSYYPVKIIYHDVATIVFWADGTKTVVKRAKKEKDNRYNAFCAALAKKLYGNNSQVNKIVKSGLEYK